MHEDDYAGGEDFSDQHEGDLAYEEERERKVLNDEADAEEAGFSAGYYEEDKPSEIEIE